MNFSNSDFFLRKIFFASIFFFLLASDYIRASGSLDTIIIDKGFDQPIRIAIPPFSSEVPEGLIEPLEKISDVIAFDLARSGQFSPMSEADMLTRPTSLKDVFIRDWRLLGVDYLLIGQNQIGASGSVQLSFQLINIASGEVELEDKYMFETSQSRDVAHKVSDEIYEEITGIRGAFSTKIAYVLVKDAGSNNAMYSVEIADSDGERSKTIFQSSEPILSVNWSPDARSVAYVSFETGRPLIVLHEVDSSKRQFLTNFDGINGSPIYSPDGRSMAMVLSKDGNPEIYIMNLETRRLRRITRNSAIDTEPSWAPDGSSILFTSDRGGQPQIYQIDLETNFLERLTFVGNYNARARLLPDGDNLVFVHRRSGTFHIAWQDLSRGQINVLTETDLDESPSIAPNGTMFIYATQNFGRGILGVVSIDGNVAYRLPSSLGDVREPAWSPFIASPIK